MLMAPKVVETFPIESMPLGLDYQMFVEKSSPPNSRGGAKVSGLSVGEFFAPNSASIVSSNPLELNSSSQSVFNGAAWVVSGLVFGASFSSAIMDQQVVLDTLVGFSFTSGLAGASDPPTPLSTKFIARASFTLSMALFSSSARELVDFAGGSKFEGCSSSLFPRACGERLRFRFFALKLFCTMMAACFNFWYSRRTRLVRK
mmetsp:Transcript_24276/g.47550  ORF Transcript_24276/g.47550 Transcript_24276/m.47550 type:complete len:202 (+) Transcript_24276:50-655(+)